MPDEFSDLAELMHQDRHADSFAVDPQVRRARRRRALIVVAILIAIVLATVGGYTGWALTAPLAAPVATSRTPGVPTPAPAEIAMPTQGASAIAIAGADEYLGPAASGTWATSGTGDALPIASISKVITALVVLDAKPLAGPDDPGPAITFGKAAHDLYDKYYSMGATIEPMPTGTTMSLHDALATILLPSACNYAEAVATWAFGSQGGYVSATRRWLDANGLTSTTIVEPTGISPRNTSTAADLIALGKIAAANPVIAAITATKSLDVPGAGGIGNTNDLLGQAGITGLKTGNLGEGSFNLLYTASVNVGAARPLAVTGIVLGGATHKSVNAEVLAMLDSIRSGFHHVPVAKEGDLLGSYSTPWGSTAKLVVGESASIFTWSDTPITVSMKTSTPKTYTDGEIVGSLTWTAGPNTVSTPLRIKGTIAEPTEWWRLTHPAVLAAG